jgi:hypothetical protein
MFHPSPGNNADSEYGSTHSTKKTETHSGGRWTTTRFPHDTSGEQYAQSDAPTKNHPYDHIDEANVSAAKGTQPMGSMYNIEKMVEAINLQLAVVCKIIGIDPMPMPNDENYDPVAAQEALQELTDPDA